MKLHSPFKPWDSNYGKVFGDAGAAAGASLYAASNVFSWSEARQMPKRQAEANKEVLAKQKADYDEISNNQRNILENAIKDYLESIDKILDKDPSDGGSVEHAYPDVPEAAEYVPVDACCEQGLTIECNISHTNRASDYVRYINRLNEQNDLIHALAMDPRFMVTLDIQSKSIQDMTRGLLPVGDVVEIVSDSAEQASLTGRIGNTRKTTARDLGISKMRIMAAGRKEFRETAAWANKDIMRPQHDITEMMLTPQQRIELALHQSQLIQQSLQNKNNALAQKDPARLAKLQIKIQKIITRLQSRSNKALLVNTHVPNYAATIVPNVSNFSQLVGGIGQAIQAAQTSHFYGGPALSQDGYVGGRTGTAGSYGSPAPSYVDPESGR